MAQYSLNLSDNLYKELRDIAKEEDKTVRELIISLLKTGLIALDANNNPKKELISREQLKDGSTSERVIYIV